MYASEGNRVLTYSYPDLNRGGDIHGLKEPLGLCSDTSGNVFVTDGGAQAIFGYRHAQRKPFTELSDPNKTPQGCSVDPETGNLAVTNYCATIGTSCSGPGNVVVYKNAKGNPKSFSLGTMLSNASFCGYDNAGNLFVDGTDGSTTLLVELAKGASKPKKVTLSEGLGTPGNVQWDGTYVTVGDATSNEIHRFTITNYQGVEAGPIPLVGIIYAGQTWISEGHIFIPNVIHPKNGMLDVINYPGGDGFHRAFHLIEHPFGVTVSVAPTGD